MFDGAFSRDVLTHREELLDVPRLQQAVARRHHEPAMDEWSSQSERVSRTEAFFLDDESSGDIE